MLRRTFVAAIALLLLSAPLLAADKSLKASLLKVDVKKKILFVKTEEGVKEYSVNADTKFIGPKGAKSEKGFRDDRLKRGVALKLLIAGNHKTLREVHIPPRAK